MTKLTREQFIGILESGKYNKITGALYGSKQNSKGPGNGGQSVCAIGAILTDTDNKNTTPAKGYQYLPQQLVDDVGITKEVERLIWTTNDKSGNDNWKAVIAMLRKEWNIHGNIQINEYEINQMIEDYYSSYELYKEETPVENFGYNT